MQRRSLTRGMQCFVNQYCRFGRDVQLVPKLSDVGDASGTYVSVTDTDLFRCSEWKTCVWYEITV